MKPYSILSDADVKTLAVSLFKLETERDRQRKVGASQISDPCTRHLAKALMGEVQPEIKYWLGGKIGTAIHEFLERSIDKSNDSLLADAIVERKITLGEIDGYGTVSSKPDLVLPSVRHLIDWKTSSRDKIKKLHRMIDGVSRDESIAYTLNKYIGQAQLYAWGLNNAGTPIDKISLVFINRDGTYENDIWPFTVDYNEDIAVQLWQRLVNLWNELQSGKMPDEYEANPHCFKCNLGI